MRPRFSRIATNGINLHVAEAGPEDGPLVILLHGFPEFWYGWRHQIGPLASLGYRVIAPDQRGYNTSDKPPGVGSYALDKLSDDVVGLIDALGRDRARVIGHDWGGVVAWASILRHPSRFDRAVILNAPHPDAFFRELKGNLGQWLKSWYTFFFQIPWLPEAALRRHDFAMLVDGLRRSSRDGTFSPEDIERYRQAWSEPAALNSMIHWYRAAFRSKASRVLRSTRASANTNDLGRAGSIPEYRAWRGRASPSASRLDSNGSKTRRTGWQHEEPERVNRLIREFF